MPMWLQRDLMVAAGKQQSSGKTHKFLLAVKGIAVIHFSVWLCSETVLSQWQTTSEAARLLGIHPTYPHALVKFFLAINDSHTDTL